MLKKVLTITLSALCIASQAQAEIFDQEASVMSMADGKKNAWSMTFFSIASVSNMKSGSAQDKEPANVTGRMIDTYDYFSLNYRIDQDSKASLRVPVLLNSAGINEYGDQIPSKGSLSDIHFVYSNYDLGYIGDIDVGGAAKWYLPTSQYSQAAKTIAKFRFEGYFEWQFGRFSSLEYIVKPDIYIQSQTAYYNPDGIPTYDDGTFMRDLRSTTKQYALEHYQQLNLDINKYFTFQTKSGFAEDWYYSSAAEDLDGSHVTRCRLGVSLEVRPMRGLNFTWGIQNETPLNSYRGQDVTFFKPDNNQYTLMTNAYVF